MWLDLLGPSAAAVPRFEAPAACPLDFMVNICLLPKTNFFERRNPEYPSIGTVSSEPAGAKTKAALIEEAEF